MCRQKTVVILLSNNTLLFKYGLVCLASRPSDMRVRNTAGRNLTPKQEENNQIALSGNLKIGIKREPETAQLEGNHCSEHCFFGQPIPS